MHAGCWSPLATCLLHLLQLPHSVTRCKVCDPSEQEDEMIVRSIHRVGLAEGRSWRAVCPTTVVHAAAR